MSKDVSFYLLSRHRFSPLPTKEQETWPLHSKNVAAIKLSILNSFLSLESRERVFDIFMSLRDVQVSKWVKPRLTMKSEHAKQMMTDGVIENILTLPSRCFPLECFLVVVEGKKRLRQIHWPREVNENLNYSSKFSLRSSAQKCQLFSNFLSRFPNSQGVSLDLVSGFYQIELPSWINFVLLDDSGRVFRMKRLPMGLSCAPELLHVLLEDVVKMAAQKCEHFVFDVHIDNVFFLSPDPRPFLRELVLLTEKFCLTFSPTPQSYVATNEVDHCGIIFNISDNTVCLRKSIQEKARLDLLVFQKKKDSVTFTFLEKIMGRILFAAPILRIPLSSLSHYFGLKKYRRLLSQLRRAEINPDSEVSLTHNLQTLIFSSLTAMTTNTPILFCPKPSPILQSVLYTDASQKGFGYVFYHQHEIITGGERWESPISSRDMALAELVAVLLSISRVKHFLLSPSLLLVFVDNTSALAALIGKGKEESMRYVRCCLDDLFTSLPHVTFQFKYVETKLNSADYFSRNF